MGGKEKGVRKSRDMRNDRNLKLFLGEKFFSFYLFFYFI